MAYVAAIDQGTTGTRSVLFDREGRIRGSAYRTHEQYYPRPGWVEHDPGEILADARRTLEAAMADADAGPSDLAAIGVTNQRETTLLWDAATGEPVHRALVWQDRRTAGRVERLREEGKAPAIRRTTGLQPDAYFSATKLEWLLDNAGDADPDASSDLRERAAAGELLFGTVDTWLVWNLTGAHVTDVTNASRTMLFDIHELAWDDDLLAEFDVPRAVLPEVRPSSDAAAYGYTDPESFGAAVPVAGALGDQQSALFGQACFEPGDAKSTCGTGSFVLANTGREAVDSDHGLLTTVAFQRSGEPAHYALEGSIFVTGAAIEWLVDVDILEDAAESERLARQVDGTGDVYVVPAFSGLGAPHWDQRARGTVVGLTRGTHRAHVVRATLEAIAYRTRDVIEAMAADGDLELGHLRVDGGAVENDLLCQLQADALDTSIVRPVVDETTALGAAYVAGLAVDYWSSLEELEANRRIDRTFEPDPDADVGARYDRWLEAVDRARGWARE